MASLLLPDPAQGARQRTGLVVSLLAHLVILGLCYFFVKWTPPYPPLPDYGVQMNFGIDPEGFGDVQTMSPASTEANKEATEGEPDPTPAPEATPDNAEPQKVTDTKAELLANTQTQEEDSPVEVPPAPKEPKPSKPAPRPVVKEEVKPAVVSKPATSSSEVGNQGTSPTGNAQAGNNNGDRPGKVGDQGSRQGTLDAKGLYGNPGSGTGSNLDLAGWNWDSKPNKVDPFDEEGKIIFEIKVDDEGNLVSVRPIEKTVSPKVVQFYQAQVEALTFSKTKDNASPAPLSTGKITILIRSR